ncbi:hypothetical protein ABT115_04700 [Streptomyces sp. NPDC001832]|uniref:hypothetical protein n=1 Tax=Streptomyces sp. NPDC001832 TaxID=3154527 RepID=UPI0033333331
MPLTPPWRSITLLAQTHSALALGLVLLVFGDLAVAPAITAAALAYGACNEAHT